MGSVPSDPKKGAKKKVSHLSRLGELLNTQRNVHPGVSRGPGGGPGYPVIRGVMGVGYRSRSWGMSMAACIAFNGMSMMMVTKGGCVDETNRHLIRQWSCVSTGAIADVL